MDKKWNLETLRASTAAGVTRAVIAEVLDTDPRTVTAAIRQGQIPAIRIGRRVLIPREQFLAIFDVQEANKTA